MASGLVVVEGLTGAVREVIQEVVEAWRETAAAAMAAVRKAAGWVVAIEGVAPSAAEATDQAARVAEEAAEVRPWEQRVGRTAAEALEEPLAAAQVAEALVEEETLARGMMEAVGKVMVGGRAVQREVEPREQHEQQRRPEA